MGFPVTTSNTDLKKWFAIHGESLDRSILTSITVNEPTTGAGQFLNNLAITNKQMFYLESIVLSCAKPIMTNISSQVNSVSLVGRGTLTFGSMSVLVNGTVVIPVNKVICYSSITNYSIYVRKVLDEDKSIDVGANLIGYTAYEDINFDAKNRLLFIGDSIMIGSTGASTKSKHFVWQTKESLKNQDTQIINKGVSGSTSQLARSYINEGMYDFANSNVSYIFENHGSNDVTQFTSVENFNAYLDDLIDLKRRLYPNSKLIFFGSSPLQNSANNTSANVFRNLKRDKVAVLKDPNILYCNLGNAFVPSSEYYVTSDASGNGVHPNDLGNEAISNVIKQFITDNNL